MHDFCLIVMGKIGLKLRVTILRPWLEGFLETELIFKEMELRKREMSTQTHLEIEREQEIERDK